MRNFYRNRELKTILYLIIAIILLGIFSYINFYAEDENLNGSTLGGNTVTLDVPQLNVEQDITVPVNDRDSVSVNVSNITSSSVKLNWNKAGGASSYKIYLGATPESLGTESRILLGTTNTTSFIATKLAPNVHMFFRVEAVGVTSKGDAHARTLGGQRSNIVYKSGKYKLDNSVREISLVAPNILKIVIYNPNVIIDQNAANIVKGHTGAGWQSAIWTITKKDGSTIKVDDVNRVSKPIDYPNYKEGNLDWQTGFVWESTCTSGSCSRWKRSEVDHSIYLVLNENIQNNEILNIQATGPSQVIMNDNKIQPEETGPDVVDIRLPFNDKYLETSVIQVNQVGYNPRATERWAYVSEWMGDGGGLTFGNFPTTANVVIEPKDKLSQRVSILSGIPLGWRKQVADGNEGGQVKQISLVSLPAQEGVTYGVHLPGVGVSYPTQVSETAVEKAYYVTMRGMFLNRWCGDLSAKYTDWVRPDIGPYGKKDHCIAYLNDGKTWSSGFFPQTTPRDKPFSLTGGHHDAGDFDLRPMHIRVGHYLINAYISNPLAFTDGQLNIPESGNGIPDILDEALHNIKSWEELQDPDDGGIREGVEGTRHPPAGGHSYANNDIIKVGEVGYPGDMPYFTYSKNPNITAQGGALMAQAARLLKDLNKPSLQGRIDDLERKAKKAYTYALSKGATPETQLYIASELFALTGEDQYKTKFEQAWDNGGFDFATNFGFWEAYASNPPKPNGSASVPGFAIGYITSPGALSSIVSTFLNSVKSVSNYTYDSTFTNEVANSKAHRSGRSFPQSLAWGMGVAGYYFDPSITYMSLDSISDVDRQKYFNAMSVHADFLLGANALGQVMYTGLGSKNPQDPLHLDSLAFMDDKGMNPVPGIPVYGPIGSGGWQVRFGSIVSYPNFDTSPKFLQYQDYWPSVPMSEFDVANVQAPSAMLFAALLAPGFDEAPECWKPGGYDHQNPLPSVCQ